MKIARVTIGTKSRAPCGHWRDVITSTFGQPLDSDLDTHNLRNRIWGEVKLKARNTERHGMVVRGIRSVVEAQILKYSRVVNHGLDATQKESTKNAIKMFITPSVDIT